MVGYYTLSEVPALRNLRRDDLKHEVDVKEQLFKLLHAVEKDQFLPLSSEFLVENYYFICMR